MGRPLPWLWLLLALLLLLPGSFGRVLVDLIGGLTLTLLLLALVLGGAGLVAWQGLRSRLRACPSCGTLSFGQPVCPACGTLLEADPSSPDSAAQDPGGTPRWPWGQGEPEIDPRTVTINVEAVDVGPRGPDKQDPGKADRGSSTGGSGRSV
jgi:hypothetical protein